jgi:hypothetical protein
VNFTPVSTLKKKYFQGMTLVIETPKGDIRRGVGWSNKAPADYGYIANTIGADGDEMDCYFGPYRSSGVVFVVDQNRLNSSEFDEHKCLLGWRSLAEAKKIYYDGHNQGFRIFRGIKTLTFDQFKKWLRFGDVSKPITE